MEVGPGFVGVLAEVVDFEFAVGEGDGVVEEEGAFGVGADPGFGVLLDAVLGVGFFGEVDVLVVVPEVVGEVAVGVALAVVAVEVVEAVFEGAAGGVEHAHAPFAGGGGGVAGGFEDLGDGDGAFGEGFLAFGLDFAIGADGAVAGVESGHEGGAGGGADGGAGVELREEGALGGHAVEVRGLDKLLAVATEVALGEVVAEDEDEVGFGLGAEGGGEEEGCDEVAEHGGGRVISNQ